MSFDDSIAAGTKLIAAALQSPNFAQGSSGWSIDRTGDAEFNSVVIRGGLFVGGTITGTTVIGSDFRSTNYVPGVSGFDLNATTSTIDFTTNPITGGAFVGASFQSADYVANTSGFLLSGPTGGPDHVEFNTAVAVNNGSITVGTGAGQVILNGTVGGGGSVTFHNGLAGLSASIVGGSVLTLKTGTVIGTGNTVPAEIDMAPGLTGGLGTVTLAATTGLASSVMRHVNVIDNPGTAINVTGAYTVVLPTLSASVTCPPSGVGTIFWRVWVIDSGAAAADFVVGSPNIVNNTSATTVFAASDNRSSVISGTVPGVTAGQSMAGSVTASGLGNPGDSLTVTMQFKASATAKYSLYRGEFTFIPSP